ncbi:MAG: hypothetical protein KAV41_03405 [Candidatus Pacebacteria bacterium]|nr:hypothetical protein [Candidatus Paceibacterota bacterium]
MEQEMVKIKVLGYGFTGKNKSNGKLYLLRTLLKNQINLLKSDERFHLIGSVISDMEFPEQIEVTLGVFSSRPLFIKVTRIGNLYFSEPCNEENEGFLMFGGNEEIPKEKYPKKIRKEFLLQFRIFLKRTNYDEFAKGVEFNNVSQMHFVRSRNVGNKLHLFLQK